MIYLIFILTFNHFTGSNFAFVSHPPENPSLIDHLGPWPWYIFSLLGIALVLYFGHRLRAPLDALARGAQALKEGRLTHRIVLATPDEFGAVAESFNAMASDLEAHRRQDDLTRASLEAAVAFRTRELSDSRLNPTYVAVENFCSSDRP